MTLFDSPVQPHPDPISAPAKVDVVGVPLAVVDYDRTLDWIEGSHHVDPERDPRLCAVDAAELRPRGGGAISASARMPHSRCSVQAMLVVRGRSPFRTSTWPQAWRF